MPVVSRTRGLHVLAEAQDHRALLRVDPVHAAADPHGGDQHQNTAEAPAKARSTLTATQAAAAAAAAKQRAQAALKISQHIVQIVLRLLRPIPGIAFLPARFVPSHALCLIMSCEVSSHGQPGILTGRPAAYLGA